MIKLLLLPIALINFVGMTFAQAGSAGGGDWFSYVLNGGPFAIVVLLIVIDKLTTTGERDRLRLENEALRNEIKSLNQSMRDDMVPVLVQLNTLMRDVVVTLGETNLQNKARKD